MTDHPRPLDVDVHPSLGDERRPLAVPPALFHRHGHLIGLGVIGLGLLVIGLGWYGASGQGGQIDGTQDIRAQLPYLLSGGLLGLALVIVGVGLLVVHALRAMRDRLEGLVLELASAPLQMPAAGLDTRGLVVAGSAAYHDTDCRLVGSAGAQALLTPEEAMAQGLRPCRLCQPSQPTPDPRPSAETLPA